MRSAYKSTAANLAPEKYIEAVTDRSTAVPEGKTGNAVSMTAPNTNNAPAPEGFGDFNVIEEMMAEARVGAAYIYADHLLKEENKAAAAMAFARIADYRDARERSYTLWAEIAQRETIGAGGYHTVGLRNDGTVVAVGENSDGQCNVSDWTNIVAVSAGYYHTVGLRSDGTVVAVGSNTYGQNNVSSWTDIVAIDAGYYHTVGLRSDGTVVAVGANWSDQCDAISTWTDIMAVDAGWSTLLAFVVMALW